MVARFPRSCLVPRLWPLAVTLALTSLAFDPSPASAQGTIEDDRRALLAFRNVIGTRPGADLTNWGSGMPLDTWFGVTVENGRVTKLEMPGNKIFSQPPANFGATNSNELSQLRVVDLSDNELDGSITDISAHILPNLEVLDLSGNGFGTINFERFLEIYSNLPKLRIIRVDDNPLAATHVPKALVRLADTLEELHLPATGIGGCIPSELKHVQILTTGPQICGEVTLSLTEPEISENGGTAIVTATLASAIKVDLRLTVSVDGPAAVELSQNGVLTIPRGDTESTSGVTITGIDNAVIEEVRTLQISVSAELDAVEPIAPLTLTVSDDDFRPRQLKQVLSGLARVVASDTVDVLGGRFGAPANDGVQLSLSGHVLPKAGRNSVASNSTGRRPTPGTAFHGGADPSLTRAGFAGRTPDPFSRYPRGTAVQARELLNGSSFTLPLDSTNDGNSPGWTIWGKGAVRNFAATPEAGIGTSGTLASGYLGVDYRAHPTLLLGVALVQSGGSSEYQVTHSGGTATVDLDVGLTSTLPYAHWRIGSDSEAWALLGAGSGTLEIRHPGTSRSISTSLESHLFAIGARTELANWQGIDLAAKSDASMSALILPRTVNLQPETQAQVTRLRLLLEGRRYLMSGPESQLSLQLEIGARHDGGADQSGAGLELGTGATYTQPAAGLSIEAAGRLLALHQAEDFEESGASLHVNFDPGLDGRGLSLSLAPGWGNSTGGAERVFEGGDYGVATIDRRATRRLDAELGYGFALQHTGGSGTITPYGGVAWSDTRNQHRLGSRLALGSTLDIVVEGTHTRQEARPPSRGVATRLDLQW